MPFDRHSPTRPFDDAQRRRARDLISRLRVPKLPDEAADELLNALEGMLLYPRVSDLLFWRTPELTADEVTDEALRYRPFVG
uniref:e9imm peptide n=1 Tax=Paractinoplanes polyasparticus TaxID=2856853 RepID=UPI001C864940|nr:e9imm peptide [Actinoplanes polyasparticus]